MAEFELVQERNISGSGVLRVPSEFKKRRMAVLYGSVIRFPSNGYANFNYFPPRSNYAWLTFARNGYVIEDALMQYQRQSFDVVSDITSQNLIAIKCAYEGILQSFANLANGAGLVVISVIDLIKDFEYLSLGWDEVRVKCYADTAVNLRLYVLPHDSCNPSKDKDKQPPPPPPPPPRVPPGTPIEGIDPPYEGGEPPDDITEPYPGDGAASPPEDLPGEDCEVYEFEVWVKLESTQTFQYFNIYRAYAPISISVPNPGASFGSPILTSKGSTAQNGNLPETCGALVNEPVGAFVELLEAEIREFRRVQ